ncbi:MAG: thioredoxin family protein [Candidatus Sungbacteria bacterium]|nr:thioredoxin family protein [Candidatus Sungbacteria bacterium]
MIHNSQKGFAMPLVIAIIGLIVVIGGISYFAAKQQPPADDGIKKDDAMMEKKDENTMMEKKGDEKTSGDTMMQYSGAILAGKSALLLDFKKADYDAALTSDKLIVLYFYANWCPICKAEFPVMQDTFNELTTDKVIGFRVNYNDNETDSDEKNMAREFGIAYQHTKVFVKNGQRILKSPEGWDRLRYDTEINKALTQ